MPILDATLGDGGRLTTSIDATGLALQPDGKIIVAGNDSGQGDDTLSGGAGDDLLQGRLGNDVLSGGPDADRFWFNSYGAANVDLIVDFESGIDRLQFDPSVFTGQLVYLPSNGQLYYDSDGLGVGVDAELVATLGTDTHPVLQVSDFLFA